MQTLVYSNLQMGCSRVQFRSKCVKMAQSSLATARTFLFDSSPSAALATLENIIPGQPVGRSESVDRFLVKRGFDVDNKLGETKGNL